MYSSSDLDKALATPVLVFALGREWKVSPTSVNDQREFQAWLEARARLKLIDAKRQLVKDETLSAEDLLAGSEVYADLVDVTSTHIDTGHYSWGKPANTEGLRTADGFTKMLQITLKKEHPNVTPEYARELLEAEPDAFRDAVITALGRAVPNDTAPKGATG